MKNNKNIEEDEQFQFILSRQDYDQLKLWKQKYLKLQKQSKENTQNTERQIGCFKKSLQYINLQKQSFVRQKTQFIKQITQINADLKTIVSKDLQQNALPHDLLSQIDKIDQFILYESLDSVKQFQKHIKSVLQWMLKERISYGKLIQKDIQYIQRENQQKLCKQQKQISEYLIQIQNLKSSVKQLEFQFKKQTLKSIQQMQRLRQDKQKLRQQRQRIKAQKDNLKLQVNKLVGQNVKGKENLQRTMDLIEQMNAKNQKIKNLEKEKYDVLKENQMVIQTNLDLNKLNKELNQQLKQAKQQILILKQSIKIESQKLMQKQKEFQQKLSQFQHFIQKQKQTNKKSPNSKFQKQSYIKQTLVDFSRQIKKNLISIGNLSQDQIKMIGASELHTLIKFIQELQEDFQ